MPKFWTGPSLHRHRRVSTPEEQVTKSMPDKIVEISALAASLLPQLAAIIASADTLTNALAPSALPEMPSSRRYRVNDARHALANAIGHISAANSELNRIVALLKEG
jgi:hypothetical protein